MRTAGRNAEIRQEIEYQKLKSKNTNQKLNIQFPIGVE
jgi:hypothetical protein